MEERERLERQKKECEDAILALMKAEPYQDFWFVRDILEKLIFKIEAKLEASHDQ